MRRRSGFGWMELIIGILLIIFGMVTFVRPGTALTGVIIVYGLIAVFTGIADIIFYVKMERHMGFGPTVSLVSGILSVLAGFMMLVYPGAARFAFAVFFPLWFIAHCISRLSHLNIVRFTAGSVYYYFSLIINILGLVVGIMMLFQPVVAMLSADMMIGIYMIMLGIDSIMIAVSKIGENW